MGNLFIDKVTPGVYSSRVTYIKGNHMIGNRIKQRMNDTGINQVLLANSVGVKQSFISRIVNDKKSPSITTLSRIADTLDTTPNFLLGVTDNPERPVDPNKTCIQLVDSPPQPSLNTTAAPLSPGPGVNPESSGPGALTEHNTNAKEAL
jgi:transcriptional regulator with XRE-family HTH domain